MDWTSDAANSEGRHRVVRRPRGVVVLLGGRASSTGPLTDAEVAIQLRPFGHRLAAWSLGFVAAIGALLAVLALFADSGLTAWLPVRERIPVVAIYAVAFAGGVACARWLLRKARAEVRIYRDLVVASQSGRECFRRERSAITQLACVPTAMGMSSSDPPTRCDLVALDADDVQVTVLGYLPPNQALFAEVWLESTLGLADTAVAEEVVVR